MNLYFYPHTTKINTQSNNPYTRNFRDALSHYHTILNMNAPSSVGILNTFAYLKQIDVLLLNWIEDIPDKKGGTFQSLYFILLVYYLKIRKKKVVWVMHNKLSHTPHHHFLKKLLFTFMVTKSDIIITHAKQGIAFAHSFSGKENLNIHYFPHPTTPVKPDIKCAKDNDVLIWGAISPYKGIDTFLNFLADNHLDKTYTIRIMGKISSAEYREKLMKFQNENIRIEDGFIETQRLEEVMRKSRVVLFTYSGESILSSGALIDTLCNRACILGPDTGNFHDMAEFGIVNVYKDFNDLMVKLKELLHADFDLSQTTLEAYFKETSWNKFAAAVNAWIMALAD